MRLWLVYFFEMLEYRIKNQLIFIMIRKRENLQNSIYKKTCNNKIYFKDITVGKCLLFFNY